MTKYGDNAHRTRRLVSIFKDGELKRIRDDMVASTVIDDMGIFRFLRRAAIVNSISKTEYTEWVEQRMREEIEDTVN